MNKKGFTLVELLAVIVILALLALLTSTAVTKLVSDSKEELSSTQMKLIQEAAEVWSAENLLKLPDVGECGYLTLEDLKYYGLLDSTVLDPKNSQEISDDLKIKITTELSSYGQPITNYEVNPNNVDGCIEIYGPICKAVTLETATKWATDETKTAGNVPNGNFETGDEYICEVSPGQTYRFYVLPDTYNDDNVRLIMDREINSQEVNWISYDDYVSAGGINYTLADNKTWYVNFGSNDKGPLTAMKVLNENTKSWSNVLRFSEKYTDEEGNYGTMKLNGKARLPKLEEITEAGCNIATESNTDCPIWLSNYIFITTSSNEGIIEGDSYGYWLLSSTKQPALLGTDTAPAVWHFTAEGLVPVALSEDYLFDIRPVITLPKYRFE